MDHGEALSPLPQSDAGNLGRFLKEQKDSRFGSGDLNTGPATEKPAPVLAA
jgi:hypothetical protein